MNTPTEIWWTGLVAISLVNLVAYASSVQWLRERRSQMSAAVRASVRIQMILAGGYVLGCAYRSLFPVFDVPRICLVDSQWSSVIVGRSVATIAELCFAAQWALMLSEFGRTAGSTAARALSRTIVPMIAVAEVCSWTAVLSTDNIGHVAEESLWGLSALVLAAGLATIAAAVPRRHASFRLAAVIAVAGICYAIYMFGVDVPMYWDRWIADIQSGRHPLDLAQGLIDVATRWHANDHWAVWKTEAFWMAAYFSVAVWASIGLIHAPRILWAGAAVSGAVDGSPNRPRQSPGRRNPLGPGPRNQAPNPPRLAPIRKQAATNRRASFEGWTR